MMPPQAAAHGVAIKVPVPAAKFQVTPGRTKIWSWMRHPISPIQPIRTRTHNLTGHFVSEVEEMTETAARLRYVTIKEAWEYVADKTRENYRNIRRALVGAFVASGRYRLILPTAAESPKQTLFPVPYVVMILWFDDEI